MERHAWKACNRQNRFGGSNPPLSAYNQLFSRYFAPFLVSSLCFKLFFFVVFCCKIRAKFVQVNS